MEGDAALPCLEGGSSASNLVIVVTFKLLDIGEVSDNMTSYIMVIA